VIDHYSVLGVSPDSTPDQIKLAWREMARQHHPDRGGDEEHFKAVKESYEVLLDASQRRAFDLARKVAGSLRCGCGRAKLPGSDLCAWCALRRSQRDHEVRSQAKRDQRRAKVQEVKDRFLGRKQPDPVRSRDPTVDWPSADDIFQEVMAEAAIRSGLLQSDMDIDVRLNLDPKTGKVKMSGRTVDALNNIRQNLEDMSRFVRNSKRYDSSG
jgi:hypothetical protein